ncbi:MULTISPECIES: proline dehydrogenase family protein [unclassified Paenibacillus]|uniref:proline dehydrogenase family protein n=1 Tax=unclassified Paenibacillus TaxID=185978 RepID=UPI0009557626|nr:MULTISPECIES: proline dehydrogenase family protein [unclassified Paenibacillus]ASS65758.1 proline dehydrogenase [Paenibacillus sp. RUD330]SIQ24921.1 L-proline dehydrogenase [Paenibacillus sp. RU4X]SIQ46718.1 L-proline dehydrogenase [Paenibacillus sp. RU4T]
MGLGNKIYRSVLLGLAGNGAVEAAAHKVGMKLGASRFVAGTTLDEAVAAACRLRDKGIQVSMDHLGEGIKTLEEADAYRDAYILLLQRLHLEGLSGNVSLKPTQMGLALDEASCRERITAIAREAKSRGAFVRLDMEDSPYTGRTIELVRRLHKEGLTNTGTVIQAYLYRSAEDVRKLSNARINLRLVKGAYKESRAIAFAKPDTVAASFKRLIRMRLDSGVYTAVATHDDEIIRWTKAYAARRGVSRGAFEFQMLYGMRMSMQEQLAAEGYTVRCYVPYGERWYPYFVRRLAERPENVGFVLRNLFKRS